MRKYSLTLCFIIIFSFLSSCSNDDSNESQNASVIGTWELSTWTIQIPFDIDNDAITSTNLLDEANCDNTETLVFDANGIVSSNRSYNPVVTISVVGGTTDQYVFNVICDMDGVIGIAGDYTQNNNSVTLFSQIGVLAGNQLTIVYENAIDIYNEALTEVVMTKDLTLVYIKK